jgi:2-dehydro-3-deoxy-D-arabinonate dehydratase
VVDLGPSGRDGLTVLLESAEPAGAVAALAAAGLPSIPLAAAAWCAPIERQEVWAAGVTYSRSRSARMEESAHSASAYDRVYEAERPELFFKSMPEKVAGPDEAVGIRRDARWSVPEPELALVLNSRGRVVGYTIGNDMSSRDIEGENLLYLPQAKIYHRSCALGPWVALAGPDCNPRDWTISIEIRRRDATVFAGTTGVDRIKRGFEELAAHLFRCQEFPQGAVLLTGTGIVPPGMFTLEARDEIQIGVSGIGQLRNPVVVV